jgi:hypothetical protein
MMMYLAGLFTVPALFFAAFVALLIYARFYEWWRS